jgi:hypothetical protein
MENFAAISQQIENLLGTEEKNIQSIEAQLNITNQYLENVTGFFMENPKVDKKKKLNF